MSKLIPVLFMLASLCHFFTATRGAASDTQRIVAAIFCSALMVVSYLSAILNAVR